MPVHGTIVVIKKNGDDGTKFMLTENVCTFGRSINCDVRIQSLATSGEHCLLEVNEDHTVKIVALKERTLVNKKSFKNEKTLKDLDVFTIGERSFRFEYPSPIQQLKENTSEKELVNGNSGQVKVVIENTPRLSMKKVRRSRLSEGNFQTPSTLQLRKEYSTKSARQKRKSSVLNDLSSKKKRVTFGPNLSPEQFKREFPPSTPLKRGGIPFNRRSTPGCIQSDSAAVQNNKLNRHALEVQAVVSKEEDLEQKEKLDSYIDDDAKVILRDLMFSESLNSSVNSVTKLSDCSPKNKSIGNESFYGVNETLNDSMKNVFTSRKASKRSILSEESYTETTSLVGKADTPTIRARRKSSISEVNLESVSISLPRVSIDQLNVNQDDSGSNVNSINCNDPDELQSEYKDNDCDIKQNPRKEIPEEMREDEISLHYTSFIDNDISKSSISSIKLNRKSSDTSDAYSQAIQTPNGKSPTLSISNDADLEKQEETPPLTPAASMKRNSRSNSKKNSILKSTPMLSSTASKSSKPEILENSNTILNSSNVDGSYLNSFPRRSSQRFSSSYNFSPSRQSDSLSSGKKLNQSSTVVSDSLVKSKNETVLLSTSRRSSRSSNKVETASKTNNTALNGLESSICSYSPTSAHSTPVNSSSNKINSQCHSLDASLSPKALNFSPSISSPEANSLNLSASTEKSVSLRLSEDLDSSVPESSFADSLTNSVRSLRSSNSLRLSESDMEETSPAKTESAVKKSSRKSKNVLTSTEISNSSLQDASLGECKAFVASPSSLSADPVDITKLAKPLSSVSPSEITLSINSSPSEQKISENSMNESEQRPRSSNLSLLSSSNVSSAELSDSVASQKPSPAKEKQQSKKQLAKNGKHRVISTKVKKKYPNKLPVAKNRNVQEKSKSPSLQSSFLVEETVKVLCSGMKNIKDHSLNSSRTKRKVSTTGNVLNSPDLVSSGKSILQENEENTEDGDITLDPLPLADKTTSKHFRDRRSGQISCAEESIREENLSGLSNLSALSVCDLTPQVNSSQDESQTSLLLSTIKTPKIPQEMFVSPLSVTTRSRSRSRTASWLRQRESMSSSPLVSQMNQLCLEEGNENLVKEIVGEENAFEDYNKELLKTPKEDLNFSLDSKQTPKAENRVRKVSSNSKRKQSESNQLDEIIEDVNAESKEASDESGGSEEKSESEKVLVQEESKSAKNSSSKSSNKKNLRNKTPLPEPRLSGMRKILRKQTPVADYRNVSGVKRIVDQHTPAADYRRVSGIKMVLRNSPKADYTNVSGMKNLFKKSVVPDYTDVRGVKHILRKWMPTPDYRNVSGLKRLYRKSKTPDYTKVEGMKYVLQPRTPLADYTRVEGVKRIFKNSSPFVDYSNLSGMEELFKTPAAIRKFEIPLDGKIFTMKFEESIEKDNTIAVESSAIIKMERIDVEKYVDLPTKPVLERKNSSKTVILPVKTESVNMGSKTEESEKIIPQRSSRKRKGVVTNEGEEDSQRSAGERTRTKSKAVKSSSVVNLNSKTEPAKEDNLTQRSSRRRKLNNEEDLKPTTASEKPPNEVKQKVKKIKENLEVVSNVIIDNEQASRELRTRSRQSKLNKEENTSAEETNRKKNNIQKNIELDTDEKITTRMQQEVKKQAKSNLLSKAEKQKKTKSKSNNTIDSEVPGKVGKPKKSKEKTTDLEFLKEDNGDLKEGRRTRSRKGNENVEPNIVIEKRRTRTASKDNEEPNIIVEKRSTRTASKDYEVATRSSNPEPEKQGGCMKKLGQQKVKERVEEPDKKKFAPILSPIKEMSTPLRTPVSKRKINTRQKKDASSLSSQVADKKVPQRRNLRSKSKKS